MGVSANQIFLIGIGVYFASAILPGALDNFFAADTLTWDAGTAAIWGLIPLAVLFVVVTAYMGRQAGGNKGA